MTNEETPTFEVDSAKINAKTHFNRTHNIRVGST